MPLAGCATDSLTPSEAPQAPTTVAPPPCDPSVAAAPLTKPVAPKGDFSFEEMVSDASARYGPAYAKAFGQWLGVDYKNWAEEGWRRLDAARTRCVKNNRN